jgi:hypothetical protein
LYCGQAAVELLIAHRYWLCREDFVGRFVRLVPHVAGDGVLAVVGWRVAVRALSTGRLPCSGGEGRVLRIAASVAEGVPVDLADCLSTIDSVNIGMVVDAVYRAGGYAVPGGGAGRGERA